MADARHTQDVPPDFTTVGFDTVGYCLESWLGSRGQGLTRPVAPDVREAIAEEAARRVTEKLAGLGQDDRLAAACEVIEGMLYMFMDLFETWRTPDCDDSFSYLPWERLN